MLNNINDTVLSSIEKINRLGNRAYIAGNTVRELLSNDTSSVYILITDASLKKIRTMFRRVSECVDKRNCLKVIENQTVMEIYCLLDSTDFDTFLRNILSNFDFTINSMAYSIKDGIIDPLGGLDDFNNKLIRFTNSSEMVLAEKTIRMLRAVRYSAQLNFTIENSSAQLIKKCSMLIKRASNDKIREELDKILLSNTPEAVFQLHTLGLMHYILPEVDICFSSPQRNKYHIYNVGEHIVHAVKNSPNDLIIRWAALLHDIGKPNSKSIDANGIIHFYGHHRHSVRLASDILRKFRFDSQQQREILLLIENHDVRIDASLIAVKKMMSRTGPDLFSKLLLLQEADNKAKNHKYLRDKLIKINEVRQLSLKIIAERQPYRISDLALNNRDLSALGLRAGHEISDTLQSLLDEVLVNPELNTKEYLISQAKKIRNKKRSRK
ncbi:MAG: HD domain-containing protein [Clostridia bacterium]|nr:HD domain-containing protein [Clostridia bacterium]